MLEKRLGPQGGGDCTIANLRAQIGQLTHALRAAQERCANLKEGGREVRSDSPGVLEAIEGDLGKSHQAMSQEFTTNLGTSHEGHNSPGCRNLNRQNGAINRKSAIFPIKSVI